jgi:hypothetical protein
VSTYFFGVFFYFSKLVTHLKKLVEHSEFVIIFPISQCNGRDESNFVCNSCQTALGEIVSGK